MFEMPDVTGIVARALAEDLGVSADALLPGAPPDADLLLRDVTTSAAVDEDSRFIGVIAAREDCVVAGLPVAAAVFEQLSSAVGMFEPVELLPLVAEGTHVNAGAAVAEIDGPAGVVLAGERTALDFMMVLSGIATETARWVAAAGPTLEVLDTRKTVPGMRELSKYAVRVGGGSNHRMGLFDMALVKDNHLERAGTISAAAMRIRARHSTMVLEIEADNLADAVEAVEADADIVLLDNMDDATLRKAVVACRAAARRRGREVLLEASGNIGPKRLPFVARAGVDRVSASALTFARPVDLGLDEA